MKKSLFLGLSLALALCGNAGANERYRERPPVVLSPDLAGPWVMQLSRPPAARQTTGPARRAGARPVQQTRERARKPAQLQQAAYRARPVRAEIDPKFLPQVVSYESREAKGTIVIDTVERFLYLVLGDGKARRYGVGVGKPGFEWAGAHKVTRKAEWPTWVPPQEMIAREAAKGRVLPARMEGGPANPMGARALYLGSTLYRIHGTNAPWTIGSGVSSGCIRMRNEDMIDLYGRVPVGTKVIVI